MTSCEFHEPPSIDEAIVLLHEFGKGAAVLAGGTALLIDIRHGERRPSHLVSLWAVPGLRGVQFDGGMRIGPLTTIAELADAAGSQEQLRGLVEAALMLGGLQVQNMATVGGNICKASPGADLVPPLLCLDASLELTGPDGKRSTSLDGFLIGPDLTALRSAEILTSIIFPWPSENDGTAFSKVMRRHAVDCSIVAVATRVRIEGKVCREARIAIGAAGPNPFRAKKAEALLTHKELSTGLVKEAARMAREESEPISDVRASADYRGKLVEALVESTVTKASERAAGREGQ